MVEIQEKNEQKLSIQSIGKKVLCLYIILGFITSSGFLPSILHSISLYLMVGLAAISFISGQRINLNKYLIWYFLFIALTFISALYTPISDWWSTIYTLIVNLAVAFSFTCFIKDKKDLFSVIYAFAIGTTLLVLILILTGRLHEDERLGTTIMDNANSFATFYMTAVLLSLWYVIYGDKKLNKLLLLVSIVLNFYALMLSGGRKYILVPFIFLYIALIFRTDRKGKKHVLFYTILIAILASLVYLLIMNVPALYNSVGVRLEGLFNAFFGEKGDSSAEIRKKMMALAWEKGWEKPLLGHGVSSFRLLSEQVLGRNTYSHNNWTEIWYNHGLVGMAVYYGFYAIMVTTAIKRRKETPVCSAFIVAFIVSIFIFEFGAITYSVGPIQILLCLCSLVAKFSFPVYKKDKCAKQLKLNKW